MGLSDRALTLWRRAIGASNRAIIDLPEAVSACFLSASNAEVEPRGYRQVEMAVSRRLKTIHHSHKRILKSKKSEEQKHLLHLSLLGYYLKTS